MAMHAARVYEDAAECAIAVCGFSERFFRERLRSGEECLLLISW
jgi:hypothetical protein